MNKKSSRQSKGFTLVELMIVIVIMGILTPAVYRLYHEGLLKGIVQFRRNSDTLRGVSVLFKYLDQDLRHAVCLVDSFGKINTDSKTLIIKSVSPEERSRLLAKPGDLADDAPDKESDCIIIYRLNGLNEVVREVYNGRVIFDTSQKKQADNANVVKVIYKKYDESVPKFIPGSSSRAILLNDLETFEFTYEPKGLESASYVRLMLSRIPGEEIRSVGSLCKIFPIR